MNPKIFLYVMRSVIFRWADRDQIYSSRLSAPGMKKSRRLLRQTCRLPNGERFLMEPLRPLQLPTDSFTTRKSLLWKEKAIERDADKME